jgi:ergothioneine biosynthesis protein EgtB
MNLLEKYKNCRQHSIDMCAPLEIEDFVPQPVSFVSPPKWNLAHTTWFFEEMILSKFVDGYQIFNAAYSHLFNSYYNTVGERVARANRGSLSRPTVMQIRHYRSYVDQHMQALLSEDYNKEIEELCLLGINHEQQHQELFYSDLKYVFALNPMFEPYNDQALVEDQNSAEGWLKMEAGMYKIGFTGEGFCFDNELGRHQVYLDSYQIRKDLVTNGEFIEFINDGGYERFEFWHDEALFWKRDKQIKHPPYWHMVDGKWHQYTLAGLRPIQEQDILCHISYYEAFAFAQWKGMRLPTEFEWEAAASQIHWGKRWEWTESAYLAYPGYQKAEGAVGEYNGKFMVNQKVLRGASVVTPKGHERMSYRNFWHPHMGHQFNGIRLAK